MASTERPDYAALPWGEIREQYENTAISVRALAARWGIAAKNTLDRRIRNENWVRRIGSIATNLALIEITSRAVPPSESEKVEEAERIHSETLREEADQASLLTARALASMQSARVRRQLELAQQIQAVGESILIHLLGVMTDTDERVPDHIKRLIAICPEGEKMAALIKAAAEAIDRAVNIERRALAMDMVQGRLPDPDTSHADNYTETAMRMVRKMDLGLGLKLREFAASMVESERDERRNN